MENRRFDRRKTLLSAKISTLDTIDDCVVHDLSAGGGEIRTLAGFQVNQKVTLDIPRLGPLQARVVWSNDKLAGIQFMAPLDEVSLSILARPPGASPESPTAPAVGTAVGSRAVGAGRAELEARLIALAQGLSHADLEVAVEQIAALARHAER